MGRWSDVSVEAFAHATGLSMQPEVVEFWSEARSCLPELTLDADDFMSAIRHLELRKVDPTRASDLLLACACLRGDSTALELFERLVVARLVPSLTRIDARPEVVDEACQLMRTKLLVSGGGQRARLSEYRGDAPLFLWVKSVAVRLMVDLARASSRQQAADPAELEARLVASGALELSHLRAQHRPVVGRALANALTMLNPREQSLLKLAFVDGLSVDRIALVYGNSRATAARWVAAARERLKALVHERVAAELDLSPTELESFFTALEFSLDRSLRTFFEPT